MPKNTEISGEFAEIIVSPDFRDAQNAAFADASDTDQFVAEKAATEELVITGLYNQLSAPERAWEVRRQAALSELNGTTFGGFKQYIHGQGGEAVPSDKESADLAAGQPEIVATNTRIVGLGRLHEEPIDFMDDTLKLIADRRSSGPANVGPENYATALKFFTDKYQEFPSSHLDPALIKQMVDRTMAGFLNVAAKDRPNFVEMTNLYVAIRTLPAGSFDKQFSTDIIGHSLEQLPDYHPKTINQLIGALAKLDLTETGESAATLLDLALRKKGGMEKSSDMGQAIRAVANLPGSPAAERAFATFMEFRNELEQPQDLAGLDVINESLVKITQQVIANPELAAQAKQLAFTCGQLAIAMFRRAKSLGNVTEGTLDAMEQTGRRIVENYTRI